MAATTYTTTTRHTLSRRKGLNSSIATASTPNLHQLYASPSLSRFGPPGLSRKPSLAALTPASLAAIPDESDDYAIRTVLASDKMPGPLTPGRPSIGPSDVSVGDTVDVPGNMLGTVRFIGSVAGRKGTFAGIELTPDHAARGKNSGDVDGQFYFNTTRPGAGIFVPLSKASRRTSPPIQSTKSFPYTPTAGTPGGLKLANQNSTNMTPPTPSLPMFSQSVGPARAPSPSAKKSRPSLARPESPVRRLQLGGPRPSIGTPASKPPARFGSPTSNKFAQSVRGTAGDPSKRPPTRERNASIGPRSASALDNMTSGGYTDDETTPVGLGRARQDSSAGPVPFNLKRQPGSQKSNRGAADGEVESLRAQLEEKDNQLKEQASTLADMEGSLTELQSLIEGNNGSMPPRRGSAGDKDAAQLRMLLKEKNDKIAMLTGEFDAHRADFRSTIDTLEMASNETEKIYEKRIEELMQEVRELQDRTADVDTVASQLKQLEELVQELEEGLEDARRGEAEARGEVEFLRGEVERTRSELRREREKGGAVTNGAQGTPSGKALTSSKELEQKEDEIRGLKAIIHSLSRDAAPTNGHNDLDKTPTQGQRSRPGAGARFESTEDRLGREKLERELADLRALVSTKVSREEELEREIESLRRTSVATVGAYNGSNGRNSHRDSRGTVVMAASQPPRSPESRHFPAGAGRVAGGAAAAGQHRHSRGPTLDTMPESDTYSTATEQSTLWCEICETAGHDILTCTNMFGPNAAAPAEHAAPVPAKAKTTGMDAVREGLRGAAHPGDEDDEDDYTPAPLSPVKTKPSPPIQILPNPMDSGMVAGKESGTVDKSKWCALCERDGHDSVDCPFEDAF